MKFILVGKINIKYNMKHLYFLKRIILVLLFLSGTLIMSAQVQILNSVVASAGNYATSGAISLSWTLGEVAVTTISAGNLMLNQGFQQPWELIIGTSVPELEINWSVKAFPNPVQDQLNVEFKLDKQADRFSMEIMDITGKRLFVRKAEVIQNEQVVQLDFSQYKEGIYILRVVSEDEKIHRVYKIRKE